MVSFTGGANTTRYIDLNNPLDPATNGDNAGKNPQGIAITADGARRLRRQLRLAQHLGGRSAQRQGGQGHPTAAAAAAGLGPGTGAGRGGDVLLQPRPFRPARQRDDLDRRASVAGRLAELRQLPLQGPDRWRGLGVRPRSAQVHFAGGIQSQAPDASSECSTTRRSVDERQDFELNIRNVSGPGNIAAAEDCSAAAAGAPTQSLFDKQHGLLLGDVDINQPPCTINDLFLKPNTGRTQVTVTLPGSTQAWPALDALNQWMQIRGPRTQRTTHRPGAPGRRLVCVYRRGSRAVRPAALHRLSPRRSVEQVRARLPATAQSGDGDLLRA